MQDSKFTLSDDEIKLLSDKNFFIQKKNSSEKIISALGELNDSINKIKNEYTNILPELALTVAGKISKGENYLGFPWIVLDNPRIFTNKDVFAFRSMFWWGNYFSFTLQLSGIYLQQHSENILQNFEKLKRKNYLICINKELWIHHLESDNYSRLDDFDKIKMKKLIDENLFFKISRKLELNDWKEFIKTGKKIVNEYFELIS